MLGIRILGVNTCGRFYNRTVNVVAIHNAHHFAEMKKNPNFNATYNLYGFAWTFKCDEARDNCIEHHKGQGGQTKDGDFVEGLDERVEFYALKNQVSLIKKRKADEIDELTERISKFESSQTFFMFIRLLKGGVCTEKEATEEIPYICFDHNDTSNHTTCKSTEAMPSSWCSHLVNEDIASHFDDRMENNAENPKDDYTHSQHHLDLLIRACAFKTEIPTIDVLVPPNGDDHLLHIMKPNDACDQVDTETVFCLNHETLVGLVQEQQKMQFRRIKEKWSTSVSNLKTQKMTPKNSQLSHTMQRETAYKEHMKDHQRYMKKEDQAQVAVTTSMSSLEGLSSWEGE
nr:phospholipase-like protein [Tanacetum cinerariifolium]